MFAATGAVLLPIGSGGSLEVKRLFNGRMKQSILNFAVRVFHSMVKGAGEADLDEIEGAFTGKD